MSFYVKSLHEKLIQIVDNNYNFKLNSYDDQ